VKFNYITALRKLFPIFLGEVLKHDDILKKVLLEHLPCEPSAEESDEDEQSFLIEDDSSTESLLGKRPGLPI